MNEAPTETCPACSGACAFWNGRDVETEQSCESCSGTGRVELGLVYCPACEEGCEHCDGRAYVRAEDVPAIKRAVEAEAYEAALLEAERASDSAAYERDPYAYYGVSRWDF